MKTLYELLEDKPEALGFLLKLADPLQVNPPDYWIVGGAARWWLSSGKLDFPKDIDILHNVEALGEQKAQEVTDDYQKAQKQTHGDVQFDIFKNNLTKWLHGAPCVGDQLAIRLKDGFVLCCPRALAIWPDTKNPHYTGSLEYYRQHANSVHRDGLVLYTYLETEQIRPPITGSST